MKRICVYCSASDGISEIYHKDAQKMGELLGQNGYDLVYGGSDFGLMGTVSQNAKKNLENLAYNINVYCENNSITKFDIEKLENYYSRILDIYIKNPQEELSKPLSDEYRQLVELYNRQIKE